MATCGEYKLERAIGWGRRSTFFAARTIAGEGAAIVIRRSRTAERTHRHAFLRAAAEQQAAVGAGCRRLAPIHAFACDETGFAYYATARYETSLADFLEAGCKADSALVREIVTGVLGALAELHEKSRRAHGNLTPGNVLLDSQGGIVLTDLAPSAKDATTADDLFALGTLIYMLVRRTARIGTLNPPLEYSPEWTEAVEDDAEGWRAFANRVLTKSRNTGPDALKGAAADLKSLAGLAAKAAKTTAAQISSGGLPPEARRAPPKKRGPLGAIFALLAVLAGGAGGVVWHKNKQAAEKARVALALAEAARIEREKALPETIKNLRADLKKPLPAEIASDRTLVALLSRISRSLDGSGSRSDVASILANWELPGKMKAQAAVWKAAPREWTRLAGELDAAADIETENETPVVQRLQKAIIARNAALDLDLAWSDTEFILKDLAAEKNRLLPDFAPWAANEILNAKSLADAPACAQAALGKLREILAFQRDSGARVLWARFEKEAPDALQPPGSVLLPGWPAKWLQKAKELTGPTDEKLAEWRKIFADAEKSIPGIDEAKRETWRKRLATERAAAEGALETDAAAIDTRLQVFKSMKTPAQEDYETYSAFLTRWLRQWNDLKPEQRTKEAANQAISIFKSNTADPRLAMRYHTAEILKQMLGAIHTPPRITANAPGWIDLTPPEYANNALRLKYSKGAESFLMPFLALDDNFAMAAFETPVILARLSGGPAGVVGDGPRIRGNGFQPVSDWLWKSPLDLQTSLQNLPTITQKSYFAAGVSPGDTALGDYCPATWISFSDASEIARNLGGQVPTADQWRLALRHPGADKRLRSGAWSRQFPLLETWKNATQQLQISSSPDSGSFSKRPGLLGGGNAYQNDTAASSAPGVTNDGKLWLTITPDRNWKPESGFINLIGNAAEWVSDNGSPAVIGGSVVSPPSLPTDRPLPVTERGGTYFDVTFRLVISLGPGGATAWLTNFENVLANIPKPVKPAAP